MTTTIKRKKPTKIKKKKKVIKKKPKVSDQPEYRVGSLIKGVYDDEVISYLSLHTASLELPNHQYQVLAAVPGMVGRWVSVSGGALPVFTYLVFDKGMMEFIRVRVELSRPNRIQYLAQIAAPDAESNSSNGEAVTAVDAYRKPFRRLVKRLFRYYPLVAGGSLRTYDDKEIQARQAETERAPEEQTEVSEEETQADSS